MTLRKSRRLRKRVKRSRVSKTNKRSRTSKRQRGGYTLPIERVAYVIHTYLKSHPEQYKSFKSEDIVKRSIQSIMDNDDYVMVHRPGLQWDDPYEYSDFLKVFMLFQRFRLNISDEDRYSGNESKHWLSDEQAKTVLENEFNLYEDPTAPKRLKNLQQTNRELEGILEVGEHLQLPHEMEAEIAKELTGLPGTLAAQRAQLNAKRQALGESLAPRKR
jgi:hypothetical protein